jgi:hypothetical protein
MRATENGAIRFQTMSDDLTTTMGTNRRERLDGALEAVEGHCPVSTSYLECLVIVVAANVTDHRSLLFATPWRLVDASTIIHNGKKLK